ncbi:hypothetical protein [Microtetraspora glauca]|uniref:Glycosyltransferase RgtA/B/C/D-like domain-containing protein n=1 Tax=Microtetraspora glauca TaxID=1996 RepID=A0ABV3GDR3_MICGL
MAARSQRAPTVLAVITLAYVVIQLLTVPHDLPLEWDEAVYTSQAAPGVPDAVFSAPRARGVTWLVAPVVRFTVDPAAIRLWMIAVSGAGFFLAFLPWCAILRRGVLALASGLFATLWVTVWYGPQVMPNLYVAYGCLLATGCFLLLEGSGERRPSGRRAWLCRAGLVLAVAGVTLLRPGDALWLALPLGLAAVARRNLRSIALLAGAVAAGFVPWVIEAYTDFGGPIARWRAAGEIQGGISPAPGFLYQFKTANGPAFCRPCTPTLEDPHLALWWLVLPVLAVCGVVAARKRAHAVAALTGFCVAVPYLFLLDYSASRFLLPVYALLAIPAAEFLVRLAGSRGASPASAPVAPILVAAVLAAHVVVQWGALTRVAGDEAKERNYQAAVVRDMMKRGVRKPCTLVGQLEVNPAAAFIARCDSLALRAGESVDDLPEREPGHVYAVLTKKRPPIGAEKWQRFVLRKNGSEPTWSTYIRP